MFREKHAGMESDHMLKTTVTALLLGFVALSIARLAHDEIFKAPADETLAAEAGDRAREMIVYYFWEPPRCDTCRKLEAYTLEAVRDGFADAMKSGRLEWRMVDVSEPQNEHFTKRYGLFTKSVVLSHVEAGKEMRWKNLEEIWLRVGDKADYLAYIRTEVEKFLKGE